MERILLDPAKKRCLAGLTRAAVVLCALPLLTACSLPRGAALMSEVTGTAGSNAADFTVYSVTRAFLPQVDTWPVTGETSQPWLPLSQGSTHRVLRPGDTVRLAIWDTSENSLFSTAGSPVAQLEELRVSPTGQIFVPYVGQVDVGNTTPEAARNRVESALRGVVSAAEVQLTMVEGNNNSANVVGGVNAPGNFPLVDSNVSVLDLVALGGGVQGALGNPRVKLQRGGQLYETSLERLYQEPRANVIVRAGDQIIIEEDKRFFLTLGAAGQEQVYSFTKDTISAAEALAISGGLNDGRADPGGVLILREYPTSALAAGTRGPVKPRVVFTIDLTSADGLFSSRNFRVNSGDLIYPTESPINDASVILALIGSGFGVFSSVNSVTGN